MVDLGSWSVLLSRSHVRFSFVPISVGKSIQSFALALNGDPHKWAVGRVSSDYLVLGSDIEF